MKTVGYFTLIGMVLLLTDISQAAWTKGIFESFEKSLAKSADENIQGMGKMMRSLDETKLTRYANGIEKGSLSETDTIAKLRKIFDGNELPELTNQVKALTGVERHTLVTLMEDSKRIFQMGIEKGIPQETILSAIQKGGDNAILGIRTMKSPEGVADCIRGVDKYGEQFIAFAKQGDEGAVRTLMKHIDDVPTHSIDDILKNPTKYFNADGKPLRAFDNIITNGRKTIKNTAKVGLVVTAIGTIVWACCPNSVFDAVEFILGNLLRIFCDISNGAYAGEY
jgi:hypothetical protein